VLAVSPAAANYRASGLVLWRKAAGRRRRMNSGLSRLRLFGHLCFAADKGRHVAVPDLQDTVVDVEW
jgi:hypothetical protein